MLAGAMLGHFLKKFAPSVNKMTSTRHVSASSLWLNKNCTIKKAEYVKEPINVDHGYDDGPLPLKK